MSRVNEQERYMTGYICTVRTRTVQVQPNSPVRECGREFLDEIDSEANRKFIEHIAQHSHEDLKSHAEKTGFERASYRLHPEERVGARV